LKELRKSLRLEKNVVDRVDVTSDESRALLAVVSDYTYALDLLDDFDHRRITIQREGGRSADKMAAFQNHVKRYSRWSYHFDTDARIQYNTLYAKRDFATPRSNWQNG
jgi:hypothetical protein